MHAHAHTCMHMHTKYVTGFWKISPNVTFHSSNIYNQNEKWELQITFTVATIFSSHLKLLELSVKYFEILVTPLLVSL